MQKINRIDTIDVIEDMVLSLNKEIYVTSIDEVETGLYKVYTCNTKWAQPSFSLDIDEVNYTIEDVSVNEYITISGDSTPTAESFDIYDIKFFSGSPIETSIELNKVQFGEDKLPMVYLLEPFTESYKNDALSLLDRESSLRLFFLTNTNYSDYLSLQLRKYGVSPMRNATFEFIQKVNTSHNVVNKGNIPFDIKYHNKWGVVITDKGSRRNIFDDNLSGCELEITIPLKRNMKCDNCCTNCN